MGSAGYWRSFASGFCLRRVSTLMESLAMTASLRFEAHVGHTTGGSMPLSQKKGFAHWGSCDRYGC